MKRLAILAVLLAAALSGGAGRSHAVFVASSPHANQGFTTAPVFNTVAVTLTNPGTPLRATVSLSATATSPDRTIARVLFQSKLASGSTWTDLCTDTEAPYSCAWDTIAAGDGSYDLRAVARDSDGYERDSTVTGRQVDNTGPAVTLTDPGSPLTATETIAATVTPTGATVTAVAIDYRTSPNGTWTQICNDTSGPTYSCPWNTTARADGLYDLRARATDVAGNTSTSATVVDRRVDNTAPSVAIANDGSPKRGTITMQATLGDGAGSGIARVAYQVRSDMFDWVTACESTTAPFTCTADSAQAPDGQYDLRAIATDNAGFSTTSATLAGVWVDNTAPSSATLNAVGSTLSGNATLGGTAADAGSGIASMRFQYAPAGTTSWADACTDTTSTYSCAWNTTAVDDGMYDVRALATDRAGNTRASAVQTNRRVDNTGPRASAVASLNNGTSGTLTSGDSLTLTYDEAPLPTSLVAGWTGTSRAISILFTRSGSSTTVTVTAGSAVPLGTLTLGRTFSTSATARFDGTMTLTGSALRLQLGARIAGNLQGGAGTVPLSWTSSASVTDAAGNAGSAVTVTGSGQL